jgi:hypothetical protein
MFVSLGRLLVALIVFASSVMLRCRPMRFRGVLVVLGGSGMRFPAAFSLHLLNKPTPFPGTLGKRCH